MRAFNLLQVLRKMRLICRRNLGNNAAHQRTKGGGQTTVHKTGLLQKE
jgi:hypothetical protein